MTGIMGALLAHVLLLGVAAHQITSDIHQDVAVDHAACDARDWNVQSSTGAHVETVDETMAREMQTQLLQTDTVAGSEQDSSDFPAGAMTAKQIRLQAQEKRREFHMNERKKWNDIELQNKEAIGQKRLSQLEPTSTDELEPTPADDLEPTPTDEEAPLTEEASQLFSSEADSHTHSHNTALKRQADSQQAIETQKKLRRRALEKRMIQKRRSKALGPAAHARAATSDQAEAVIDLATKNSAAQAALDAAVNALAAKGTSPQIVTAAQEVLGSQQLSFPAGLLETSNSSSEPLETSNSSSEPQAELEGPAAIRAKLARQLLDEQRDKRESLKRIRMAAAGLSSTEAPAPAPEMQVEPEHEKVELVKEETTPAELRAQAMKAKVRKQEAMREAAAEARLQNMARKHHALSESLAKSVPLNETLNEAFVIKPAPADVKLSPAARRNQIKRLAQAQKQSAH